MDALQTSEWPEEAFDTNMDDVLFQETIQVLGGIKGGDADGDQRLRNVPKVRGVPNKLSGGKMSMTMPRKAAEKQGPLFNVNKKPRVVPLRQQDQNVPRAKQQGNPLESILKEQVMRKAHNVMAGDASVGPGVLPAPGEEVWDTNTVSAPPPPPPLPRWALDNYDPAMSTSILQTFLQPVPAQPAKPVQAPPPLLSPTASPASEGYYPTYYTAQPQPSPVQPQYSPVQHVSPMSSTPPSSIKMPNYRPCYDVQEMKSEALLSPKSPVPDLGGVYAPKPESADHTDTHQLSEPAKPAALPHANPVRVILGDASALEKSEDDIKPPRACEALEYSSQECPSLPDEELLPEDIRKETSTHDTTGDTESSDLFETLSTSPGRGPKAQATELQPGTQPASNVEDVPQGEETPDNDVKTPETPQSADHSAAVHPDTVRHDEKEEETDRYESLKEPSPRQSPMPSPLVKEPEHAQTPEQPQLAASEEGGEVEVPPVEENRASTPLNGSPVQPASLSPLVPPEGHISPKIMEIYLNSKKDQRAGSLSLSPSTVASPAPVPAESTPPKSILKKSVTFDLPDEEEVPHKIDVHAGDEEEDKEDTKDMKDKRSRFHTVGMVVAVAVFVVLVALLVVNVEPDGLHMNLREYALTELPYPDFAAQCGGTEVTQLVRSTQGHVHFFDSINCQTPLEVTVGGFTVYLAKDTTLIIYLAAEKFSTLRESLQFVPTIIGDTFHPSPTVTALKFAYPSQVVKEYGRSRFATPIVITLAGGATALAWAVYCITVLALNKAYPRKSDHKKDRRRCRKRPRRNS